MTRHVSLVRHVDRSLVRRTSNNTPSAAGRWLCEAKTQIIRNLNTFHFNPTVMRTVEINQYLAH